MVGGDGVLETDAVVGEVIHGRGLSARTVATELVPAERVDHDEDDARGGTRTEAKVCRRTHEREREQKEGPPAAERAALGDDAHGRWPGRHSIGSAMPIPCGTDNMTP